LCRCRPGLDVSDRSMEGVLWGRKEVHGVDAAAVCACFVGVAGMMVGERREGVEGRGYGWE